MHHSKGLQENSLFLEKNNSSHVHIQRTFALTESGLFDEFVPREISQATSSLNVSTRLSILDTSESILETQDPILESFENRESSLEDQDVSDCQVTFARYCRPHAQETSHLQVQVILHVLVILYVQRQEITSPRIIPKFSSGACS